MQKETASPEVSLKPLSWGQSGGWVVFYFLGDAGKLKKKAITEKVPQRGTLRLRSRWRRWVPGATAKPRGAETGTGAAGPEPGRGEPCPHHLGAIVIRGTITTGFFGLGGFFFFYSFVSGFSVAASYPFLCFGLVVFQGFLLFFFFFFGGFSLQS